VAADLATQKVVGQQRLSSTATVTGMIDGTGAIGAAITQYLVGFVKQTWNWDSVFTMLVILQGCCAVFLARLFYLDIRRIVQRVR
jgi:MFS transporter, OPA family, solute carrier family 37 (glycerol-3-phosphate transporter), member 3